MININIKSNKGITMITLIIAIIIMLVISSTLIYNANNAAKTRVLNNMYSDIQVLKDKIDLYYSSYEALPIIKTEYTNTSNIIGINQNDGNKYYVIDLEILENLTLNYGEGYKEFKTTLSSNIVDIYIVNEQSHNVYYVKGIKLDNNTYYTIPGEHTEVEVPTIANIKLDNIDGNVATLTVKGVNKSCGISAMKVYVAGNEYKSYSYDTNNKEVKTENIQVANLSFGEEIYCYVEVTDIGGQTKQSDTITLKNEDTIATAQDLKKLSELVNAGNSYEGKIVSLKNDIDLSTVCSQTIGTWTPIGNPNINNAMFKGVFEGNNNTIESLYVNDDSTFTALFGCINNGTIQNLSVKGSVKGRRSTAGIVGFSIEGNVINCKNYCTINTAEYGSKYNTNSNDRKYGYAGGIVGNNGGLIEKCTNYGQITGLACLGGIAGANSGQKATIKDCFNIAQVKSVETMRDAIGTGGIVGNNQSKVLDVYNKGKVITEGRETAGIIGWQGLGGNAENAYNTGDVVGSDYVGGCVGIMSGDSTVSKNMYNTGKVQGMSDADEIGKSDSGYLGMVVGRLQAENVLSDYYFNTTQSVMSAWTEEEINTYLGENFTKDINNINDGYPVLKWQVEENTKQGVINE